jgi:hypothetical protein
MLQTSPNDRGIANALSLMASVVAAWLALLYQVCRLGVAEPEAPWLLSVGLSWFLINAGFGVRCSIVALRGRLPGTWLLGEAPLSLAALLVLTGLGAWPGGVAAVPAAVCGAVLFGIRCARTLPSLRWRSVLAAIAGTVILALTIGSAVWSDGYTDPLLVRGLSLGLGHIDSLFHASLANMIKTYGVPSTGLDGLVFCPYHFGTHFLFAQLSRLLQISVIDFYQLGFPVLFFPWFIHAIGLATEAFLPEIGPPRGTVHRQEIFLPFVLLLLAFGGFVPSNAAMQLGYYMSGFTSESMCVAQTVLLLILAGGWPLFFRGFRLKESLPRFDRAAIVVALPLLVVGLTLLKISVGSVLLAVVCLLFLRSGWWRRSWLGWCSVVAAGVAFLVVVPFVFAHASRNDTQGGLMPLAYLREYVAPPNGWLFHLLLQYSWALAVVVLRVRQAGVKTIGDLGTAVRSGVLLDVEFLALVALIGSVPGLVWRIDGGSAVYFFGIQRWVALPMLLALACTVPVTVPGKGLPSWRDRLRAVPLGLCLGWSFLAVALGTCLLNTSHSYLPWLMKGNLMRRGFYMPEPDGKDQAAKWRDQVQQAFLSGHFSDGWEMVETVTRETDRRSDPRWATLKILRSADQLPVAEKRQTVLFVPKRNKGYWKMLPNPRATPFLGPAVAGLAMIDGLPDPNPGIVFDEYGYQAYDLDQPRPTATDPEQEKAHVLQKARALGFGRVLVLDADKDDRPRVLEWCLGTTRSIWAASP